MNCNEKDICEHKKRRYNCVPCHSGGICEYNRRRYDCKEYKKLTNKNIDENNNETLNKKRKL